MTQTWGQYCNPCYEASGEEVGVMIEIRLDGQEPVSWVTHP